MTSLSATLAPPVLSRSAVSGAAWWAAVVTLCLLLLAPLLVVDVPPLLDYPNHLARAFVLASLPQDTVLAHFYAPHWSIIPNLGLDLITPPLIHLMPVYDAGRLIIAAALLLPTIGAIAYNTALGGRWWALGVGLAAYNNCLLYGFLNFEISLGIALLLAAAWLRWREHRPVLAITLAMFGAPILFTCHLMGLVFFGFLIGGAELCHIRRRTFWSDMVRRGAVLLLIFALPFALYAASDLQQLGGDATFVGPGTKALQAVTTFYNYNFLLDGLTAAVAIFLPLNALLRRLGTFPPPAAIAAGLIGIAYLAAPSAWKGTHILDTRFAVMLAFMVFAGFVPARWSSQRQCCSAAAIGLLFVARMALLTVVWTDHRTDLADLRTVLAPVQPGQAVYVAEVSRQERPAYWAARPHWRAMSEGTRMDEHLAALALIEHRAWWPFQFDNPSQQPIVTREPYAARAATLDHVPTFSEASLANVCGYDYVLLMEADAVPPLPPQRFRMLAQAGFTSLYAIERCNADPPMPPGPAPLPGF